MSPLDTAWQHWVRTLTEHAPEQASRLAPGISPEEQMELVDVYPTLGAEAQAYLTHCGGERDHRVPGTFLSLKAMSVTDILRTRKMFQEIVESGIVQWEVPADPRVAHPFPWPGHLPLFEDTTGNYLGVDCNPSRQGHIGQVIRFGADLDEVEVVFENLAELFDQAARWLQSGEVVLDAQGELLSHPPHPILDLV